MYTVLLLVLLLYTCFCSSSLLSGRVQIMFGFWSYRNPKGSCLPSYSASTHPRSKSDSIIFTSTFVPIVQSFGDSDGNVDITMDAANAQHANANASASVPRTLSTALDGDSEGNHETSCAPGTFIGKYAVLSKLVSIDTPPFFFFFFFFFFLASLLPCFLASLLPSFLPSFLSSPSPSSLLRVLEGRDATTCTNPTYFLGPTVLAYNSFLLPPTPPHIPRSPEHWMFCGSSEGG